MGVRYNFKDVDKVFAKVRNEVRQEFDRLGREGVEYAKENGNYHDVTGNLRRSNQYRASEDELVLENTAEYASHVEARGKDVISGAFLHVQSLIEK